MMTSIFGPLEPSGWGRICWDSTQNWFPHTPLGSNLPQEFVVVTPQNVEQESISDLSLSTGHRPGKPDGSPWGDPCGKRWELWVQPRRVAPPTSSKHPNQDWVPHEQHWLLLHQWVIYYPTHHPTCGWAFLAFYKSRSAWWRWVNKKEDWLAMTA